MNPAAATPHDWFLLACVAGTVLLLLLLVVRLRLHPALGLSISAMALGVAAGMSLTQVPQSFTQGVGVMMGHIAIILAMGAILGQLLASSGGAAALGGALVEGCGPRALPWVLLGLGLLVGMSVFFEVGIVLLMPIVAAAARRSHRPPILVGLPLLAGLSIMHGLLPPHPAPILAATAYHADLGRTIFWGLLVGVAASVIAGPILGWLLLRRWTRRQELANIGLDPVAHEDLTIGSLAERSAAPLQADTKIVPPPAPAGALRAVLAILLPIALIFIGSWADAVTVPGRIPNQILHFVGYPDIAMLIGALTALATLGSRIQIASYRGTGGLRRLTADSFGPIAGVFVILAAAGGLSGVLRDSGAAQATVSLALGLHTPPLVLAWLLAVVVRVCMGSSTVSIAVVSAVLAPLAGRMGVRPEMLVLATGSGSLMLSHVNDSGFWLVASLFKLEVKQALATWSVMESVLSVSGLVFTLLLSAVLR